MDAQDASRLEAENERLRRLLSEYRREHDQDVGRGRSVCGQCTCSMCTRAARILRPKR